MNKEKMINLFEQYFEPFLCEKWWPLIYQIPRLYFPRLGNSLGLNTPQVPLHWNLFYFVLAPGLFSLVRVSTTSFLRYLGQSRRRPGTIIGELLEKDYEIFTISVVNIPMLSKELLLKGIQFIQLLHRQAMQSQTQWSHFGFTLHESI